MIGLVVATLAIGAASSLISAAPPLAQSPSCQQIRAACKAAGFVQGGQLGNRLVKDCLEPIVYGARQPQRGAGTLPDIAPALVAACGSNPAQSPPQSKEISGLTARDGGQSVFDSHLNVIWLADANLPARQAFGVPGINRTGSMDYATALRWVAAMNA